jgi:hypothetical protein
MIAVARRATTLIGLGERNGFISNQIFEGLFVEFLVLPILRAGNGGLKSDTW